ncbi:MAG: prohibitin family protein [Alphaproteobacteria bacterium]|nr:prohibitin family protein [Alphaproteobacteria bacterium]
MTRAPRFVRALGLAAVLGLASACTATTESTEVAVRVVKVPLLNGRGIVPQVYAQGATYFFFRPFSDWYVYDVAIQNLVMTRETNEGRRGGDDSLRFKTIDGNDVSVNVTIQWSIVPDKTPLLLQTVGHSTLEVEEKLVRPVTRAVVRDILNELTSEEYYQADKRFELAETAQVRLDALLEPQGITIQQILLAEHKFTDTYEGLIRDKKVAEQDAARLVSETEAASEEMKRDLERAKGEVAKAVETARGKAQQRKLEADAMYFERQKQAEAILAEKTAKAEGLKEQARALAGSGGTQMVKLAIAESLKGKRMLFLPAGEGMDVRTTDMNNLLRTLGVSEALRKKGD